VLAAVADYWGGTIANGNAFRSNYTFTRPADTTAYAVGDVVGATGAGGAVHSLPLIGPAGGVGQIMSVRLRMAGTALPSGMAGGFRLHLYNAAPANVADNAVFAAVAGERTSYIDYIDIPTLELIGGGFLSKTVNYVGIPFQLVSTGLWAELVTATGNGFTPVSGAAIDLTLMGVALGLQG
jgi:hypothetical protein